MAAHAAKIAITIDPELLKRLDQLVDKNLFKNRSQAIQAAVLETVKQFEHSRLAAECEKLDIGHEQQLAEANIDKDMNGWPEY